MKFIVSERKRDRNKVTKTHKIITVFFYKNISLFITLIKI